MRLAENVSKLKRQANFSIRELAEYTGLSQSTVRRVLSHRASTNADYKPTYNTIKSIAKSLGVSSDEIYKQRMTIQVIS
jgi:transcriptional regulator with XRE-family HTH domain